MQTTAAAKRSEVFRVLADPTRRAIYERVMRGEATVSHIASGFSVSQPAVSQHLAALRKAGLVSERREGRHAHYRARPEGLAPLIDWIEHYEAFWAERGEKLKKLLGEMEK